MGHIVDNEFIRGNVPMTKQEIRAISIAKLNLKEDSVLVDIGAGTGSVSIEAATYLKNGKVYAVEKKIEGIELIKLNIKKFGIKNLEVIQCTAPEDLQVEKFDKMFIGGSGGNMEEIIKYFLKNSLSKSTLVINVISLETLSEIIKIFEKYRFENVEIVNISVSRGKKIGKYTMMTGENPIYIISAEKGEINE